jgi:toxin ParE1/3/4
VRVRWSPLALERVVEIGEHIASDRPLAAADWVDSILASVDRLTHFPLSGRAVPESKRLDLREIIHGRFRVIYRVRPDEVLILTVRHSRQELYPDDPDLQ